MINHVDLINKSTKTKVNKVNTCISQLPPEVLEVVERSGFDLITLSDFSGQITFVSESVEKVLGYSKDDLLGKSVFRYILQDDQKYVDQHFDRQSYEPQKYYLHIRHQLGKYIIFESNISVVDFPNGEKQILAVSKDISDKKQAEEIFIRSEKMSIAGQLAAGIAHEIRNPLTSLRGFIQLLQAGMENKEAYYKIMMDEIDKINTITSELLFISKPMTDEKSEESVSEMVSDVITLLKTQANLYNIDLYLDVQDEVVIYCDRSQLKQVFINLIKNAIEEMTAGGEILTTIKKTVDTCVISIVDQGPGIPKHLIHKLKEPFFTTKKNGTGLGLMISNQIIENHHGFLKIESEKNVGSTFSIHLPI
ncbi:two-component system, sporulation sensor kinase A [Gracilibacillus ureilyticus]|uniref:histidine kinase n=1 Tax=Gracilibacillus ureilyticus TaxID=531814 RepID=A0A1H9LDG3_9BACI|nr:ATP-binding protein [Gracilibacillus ureilyticus]SER09476.1 two-component system, sporulation sensor kinase A [Gracilibacillus ureilyticus]